MVSCNYYNFYDGFGCVFNRLKGKKSDNPLQENKTKHN